MKPIEVKSVEVKSIEVKPIERTPAEVKQIEVKPVKINNIKLKQTTKLITQQINFQNDEFENDVENLDKPFFPGAEPKVENLTNNLKRIVKIVQNKTEKPDIVDLTTSDDEPEPKRSKAEPHNRFVYNRKTSYLSKRIVSLKQKNTVRFNRGVNLRNRINHSNNSEMSKMEIQDSITMNEVQNLAYPLSACLIRDDTIAVANTGSSELLIWSFTNGRSEQVSGCPRLKKPSAVCTNETDRLYR